MPTSSASPTKTPTESSESGTGSGAAACRGLCGEDEPGEVGAGLGRDRDVLLARQAADLHERAAQEVGELRAGIGRAHERRADEDRVGAGELRGRGLRAVRDAALGDDRPVARGARNEVELHGTVDLERAQVARVHADHLGVERNRACELVGVVRLDEQVEPEGVRLVHEQAGAPVVDVAQEEQRRVGTRLGRSPGNAPAR